VKADSSNVSATFTEEERTTALALLANPETRKRLVDCYSESEKTYQDPDKLADLLLNLEKKLKTVPEIGSYLAKLPILIALIRDYASHDYLEAPRGTIIAVIAALIYFITPIDAIPDSIPIAGLFDDGVVLTICTILVSVDIEAYNEWRIKNGKLGFEVHDEQNDTSAWD